jgi:pimeloyl-ACP methyl ester carboxylesterase
VLFIKGSESRSVQEEDIKDIKELFPSATINTIEGAGHWVHADKPGELLEEVLTFLAAE